MMKLLSTTLVFASILSHATIANGEEVISDRDVPPIFFTFRDVMEKFGTPAPTTTAAPSDSPSVEPSVTISPTKEPSGVPSSVPSFEPTQRPTQRPSMNPSLKPSQHPSQGPTQSQMPSPSPSIRPSPSPSLHPSALPSNAPSDEPSVYPSALPSLAPSMNPSQSPSDDPSALPSQFPSQNPTDTNVKMFSTELKLVLDQFSKAMFTNQLKTLEDEIKSFITSTKATMDGVDIVINSVKVTAQLQERGAKKGFLGYDDAKSSRRLEDGMASGLLLRLHVKGEVSYGTLPDDFSFAKSIVPGLENNFDTLSNNIDGAFKKYHSVEGTGSSNGEEEHVPNVAATSMVLLVALACGGGGMVVAISLFLVHRKKTKSRQLQEFTNSNVSRKDDIMMQNEDDFLHSQSSLKSSVDMESGPNDHYKDPAESELNKDMRNPYANMGNMYPTISNQGPNMSMPSDLSGSDMVTPTGSTSTVSMGINLSPEALYEAKKQHQSFSFVPQDPNTMGITHSYPDRGGRLVYKSFVCSAPQGALGIIIDTTAEGPMVHAIKPTSQLLGCVAPGDIVVGLDNIETRQMTAPALTRLMARKAQQEERKITLLRPMSS